MDYLPISVIIVAKDAERTIEDCLRSVQRNNPAEIVVVDGNSTDRTIDVARRFTERLYSDEGMGLTYARQLGIERANQAYIAFVDSDVIMTDGALAKMLEEFQNSDYAGISACETALMQYASYWQWAQYQHYQLSRRRGDHLCMLASLFRRDTLLKYGFYLSKKGLDNRMDDLDLEIRLRRDGYRFGKSSASFHHQYRPDFRSFVKYQAFLGRVYVYYIRKYGPWHINFWPSLTRLYWLGFFLLKGKLKLVPYIIVDGGAETFGQIRGFFELVIPTVCTRKPRQQRRL
jgi:glycosyltransferase involved in cell wall biosynthesis